MDQEKFHSDRIKPDVGGSLRIVYVIAIFASVPVYRRIARKHKNVERHLTFRDLVTESDNNVKQLTADERLGVA